MNNAASKEECAAMGTNNVIIEGIKMLRRK
jgi:hypothetical protein